MVQSDWSRTERSIISHRAECTVRYCRKIESRPDFVAIKGLVEQHTPTDASLVQALHVLSTFFASS